MLSYFTEMLMLYITGPTISILSPNSTWLVSIVTSRHDSTRSTCRESGDERVEPCCSTSSTVDTAKMQGLDWHVERVESTRVETWRVEWNLC